eukprot:scaffold33794_cov112-Isochrysis_galbana.AAC.4
MGRVARCALRLPPPSMNGTTNQEFDISAQMSVLCSTAKARSRAHGRNAYCLLPTVPADPHCDSGTDFLWYGIGTPPAPPS